MATKVNGLAQTTLSVDDSAGTPRDIRNAITDWQCSTPKAVQDVTGLDKSANERIGLLTDFSITMNGVFDTAANGAHAVFSTITSASAVARTVTITTNGKSLPNETLFTDYAITRSATGELTWSAPGVLADGTVPTWA